VFLADSILARQFTEEAAFQTSCYPCHQHPWRARTLLRADSLGTLLRERRRRPSLGLDWDRKGCSRNGRSNARRHQHAANQRGRSPAYSCGRRTAYQPICTTPALAGWSSPATSNVL